MHLEEMDRQNSRTPELVEAVKKTASQMWTGEFFENSFPCDVADRRATVQVEKRP